MSPIEFRIVGRLVAKLAKIPADPPPAATSEATPRPTSPVPPVCVRRGRHLLACAEALLLVALAACASEHPVTATPSPSLASSATALPSAGASPSAVPATPEPSANPTLAAGAVWTPTGVMTPTGGTLGPGVVTSLADGTVLVVSEAGSQIYDQLSRRWKDTQLTTTWHPTGAVVLLKDGRVLAAGGEPSLAGVPAGMEVSYAAPVASAQVFSPKTYSWDPTGAMKVARRGFTATLLQSGLVLVAGGDSYDDARRTPYTATSAELYDPATGIWRLTGSMHAARRGQAATLLRDGRVLVSGGTQDGSPSAELYDPNSGRWTPTGSMVVSRSGHTATLLRDGRVLVAGGEDAHLAIAATTELYDPAIGTWAPADSMSSFHSVPVAAVLGDGRVLIAGGGGWSGNGSPEVYDPKTGSWTQTANPTSDEQWIGAARLPDGRVMVVGPDTAEIYGPSWVMTGTLPTWVGGFPSTVLRDGRILVGGRDASAGYSAVVDPSSGVATLIASKSEPGWSHSSATLLRDGRVLVAGGDDKTADGAMDSKPIASADVFDPATGRWTPTDGMAYPRSGQHAIELNDGRVLVFGGLDNGTATAELWDPSTGHWSGTASPAGLAEDGSSTVTKLRDGRVLYTNGQRAQLYDPTAGVWTPTGPMVAGAGCSSSCGRRRADFATSLLPDGRVLVAGGRGATGVLSSAELLDPAAGRWAPTGNMVLPLEFDYQPRPSAITSDGRVLIAGWEMFDPGTGTWTFTAPLPPGFGRGDLMTLPDGRLVAIDIRGFLPNDPPVMAVYGGW